MGWMTASHSFITHDSPRCFEIGRSEQGRAIRAAVMGSGSRKILLSAGAHSDEPVGPTTLRGWIAEPGEFEKWFDCFTFFVIPDVNPDGAAMNAGWMAKWPDAAAYLEDVMREPPGRDIEFGYPAMRAENRAVSDFIRKHAPFDLYVNLHGMAFAAGAMLLIERLWTQRCDTIKRGFLAALKQAGIAAMDWDRRGDKGFEYLGPGFQTTPEGAAMRKHFQQAGDPATAELFHDSSMEFVRSCGGDPLCLVTELPLFLLTRGTEDAPGMPRRYLEFRDRWKTAVRSRGRLDELIGDFGIRELSIDAAVKIQRRVIELGIEAVARR